MAAVPGRHGEHLRDGGVAVISSPYVAGVIYSTAHALSTVTGAVGDRIYRRWYSGDEAVYTTPFIIYRHIEPTVDDGPLGGPVATQTHRFEVALYDDGNSFSNAVMTAISDLDAALQDIDTTISATGWQITSRQEQEIPDLDIEYGLPYVRVGGIYAFTVG